MTASATAADLSCRRLTVHNRQRRCRINTTHLRRLVYHHLEDQLRLGQYDLAIHLLSAQQMAGVNEKHLQHPGPTDVITFDYGEAGQGVLRGELLVCPGVAVEQAREFGTSWESEILRYIIHGILHLRGFDDRRGSERRIMKREEDRLLKALVKTHPLRRLRAPRRPSRKRPLESTRSGS